MIVYQMEGEEKNETSYNFICIFGHNHKYPTD